MPCESILISEEIKFQLENVRKQMKKIQNLSSKLKSFINKSLHKQKHDLYTKGLFEISIIALSEITFSLFS